MVKLPHSGEMVLIDEILELKDGFIRTKTLIKADNAFLQDEKFQTHNMIEIMAQSLGAYQGVIKKDKFSMGFLVGCRDYEILKPNAYVGDELITHSKVSVQDESGFGVWESEIYSKDELVAKATLSVLSPSEELFLEMKNG